MSWFQLFKCVNFCTSFKCSGVIYSFKMLFKSQDQNLASHMSYGYVSLFFDMSTLIRHGNIGSQK